MAGEPSGWLLGRHGAGWESSSVGVDSLWRTSENEWPSVMGYQASE
jgi:hypothetical protein